MKGGIVATTHHILFQPFLITVIVYDVSSSDNFRGKAFVWLFAFD